MVVVQARDIFHFQKSQWNNTQIRKKKSKTYILARPKSIILTLLVTLLTHKMFSGWKDMVNKLNKDRGKKLKFNDDLLYF